MSKVSIDQISEKGRKSLVSFVDRESEEILIKGLSALLPAAGFITEEEMTRQEIKELTWIIDPLDGTTNFLNSVPFFSVSVALYSGRGVVMGIVHDVMNDEVYHAISDKGAFMGKKKLSVSEKLTLDDVLIGTGFPYNTERTSPAHFETLRRVLHHTRGIRRFGSAALDLCYVSSGRLGAFYENSLNSYDIAAGALIVKEAGGIVSDFKGGDKWLFEGEILASAPQFHTEMVQLLNTFQS